MRTHGLAQRANRKITISSSVTKSVLFVCVFFLCACVHLSDIFSHRHLALLILRLIVSFHCLNFICITDTSSFKQLLFSIVQLFCRISPTASSLHYFLIQFSVCVERNLAATPPGLCLSKPKTNQML